MSVLESLGDTADGAIDTAKTYAKSTEAYLRLQIFKHLGVLMTFIIKVLLIGGLFLTALLFLSVGLMVVLSEWLDSVALACALVGGFFFIVALILYFNTTYIDKKVLLNLSQKLK